MCFLFTTLGVFYGCVSRDFNKTFFFSGFRRRYTPARRHIQETRRHVDPTFGPQRRHNPHQQQWFQCSPSCCASWKSKVSVSRLRKRAYCGDFRCTNNYPGRIIVWYRHVPPLSLIDLLRILANISFWRRRSVLPFRWNSLAVCVELCNHFGEMSVLAVCMRLIWAESETRCGYERLSVRWLVLEYWRVVEEKN